MASVDFETMFKSHTNSSQRPGPPTSTTSIKQQAPYLRSNLDRNGTTWTSSSDLSRSKAGHDNDDDDDGDDGGSASSELEEGEISEKDHPLAPPPPPPKPIHTKRPTRRERHLKNSYHPTYREHESNVEQSLRYRKSLVTPLPPTYSHPISSSSSRYPRPTNIV
jgi:hypothetical protein